MPYNGDLFGTQLGPIDWPATTRRVLAFRSVLAPDDAGGLDDAAGPLEALPMQVVAPEWVLALMARDLPGQELSSEEQRRGVHVSQDSRFLGPIRAGDALRVSGEIVGVRASRAGAVVTTRYETRVGETLAAVSTCVSILRGVAVTGPEQPEPGEPPWPAFVAAGPPRSILTSRGFPHQYSECAEIWNPIHTERAVALAAGLDDILIHGTALWALAGLALTPEGGRLSRLAARFRAPAWAGEAMSLQAGEPAGSQMPFQLTAPDGRLLCEGFAEI
jgi:acyl dehydratase